MMIRPTTTRPVIFPSTGIHAFRKRRARHAGQSDPGYVLWSPDGHVCHHVDTWEDAVAFSAMVLGISRGIAALGSLAGVA